MARLRENFGRLRFGYITALLLSAAYFIGLSLYLTSHRLMWADEFTGFFVIADPSWRHAFESWSRAADSGGPLFYVIGHCLVHLFGPHPWMLRLFSAGCLWAAAVLWFDLLRRKFSAPVALFSCALVWLGDSLFIDHLGQVRFYGLLVLGTTLASVVMIWIEDHKPRAAVCFLLMFAGSGLLITSHMLGVIFSTILLATMVFSRLPISMRVAALGGGLSSWLLILLFRTAIKMGSAAYTWVLMPHGMDLLRYYLHTPIYSVAHPTLSVVSNMLVGLLLVSGAFPACRKVNRDWIEDDGRRLLLILSALLLALPLGMFVASHLYKPVWVGRYMMPYDLGVAGSCTGALWLLAKRIGFARLQPYRFVIASTACVAVLSLHVYNLREQHLIEYSAIDPYLSLNSPLPLVLQDANSFLESRYYGGDRGSRVFFLLRKKFYGTLNAVQESGYQEGLIYDEDFFASHQTFLYLDVPWAHDSFLEQWKVLHPTWHIRQVGQLPYQASRLPLLEIEQ